MKKLIIGMLILGVLVAGLSTFGYAQAQTVTPPAPQGRGNGMGGRGMRANTNTDFEPGSGFLHEEMIAAIAEKLGLSADELDARIDNGERASQVAFEKGLSFDEFSALLKEARSNALDQAVANGKVSQEQADWMKQRGPGNGGFGRGRGAGQGRFANPDCPYYPQTQP